MNLLDVLLRPIETIKSESPSSSLVEARGLTTAAPDATPQPSKEPEPIAHSRPHRGFLVSTDGSARCLHCGNAGMIPHHLSMVFWKFWDRATLQLLVSSMRMDERLHWIASHEVQVSDSAGGVRYLREQDGRFVERADDERTR